MNNLPDPSRESLWRRRPTDVERAGWDARPEIRAEWEREARLSEMLAKTSDFPVSSNFTARVMQEIEREDRCSARRRFFSWNWRALLPRLAITAAVLLCAGATFRQYELNRQRTQLAKNVVRIAESQPLPSVEALDNFDAIQRMGQPAQADEELLALLP